MPGLQLALAQARGALTAAGEEGMRLTELEKELFLFRDAIVKDAIRMLRLDPDVVETLERRETEGHLQSPRRREVVVLRSRVAVNSTDEAVPS